MATSDTNGEGLDRDREPREDADIRQDESEII